MKDFDDSIRDALRADEADLGKSEPSIVEQMKESFRGRNRWLVIMSFALMSVFLVAAAYCGYQHFHGPGLNGTQRMMWGMGLMYCVLSIALIKIWYWMELNKNAVLRELKRLELQVARLAESRDRGGA